MQTKLDKIFRITVDISNRKVTIPEAITWYVSDANIAHINCQVIDEVEDSITDIASYRLSMRVLTPSKILHEIQFSIADVNTNTFTVTMTDELIKEKGRHQCELVISYLGDILTSQPFNYNMVQSIASQLDDTIAKDSHYPLVLELEDKLNEVNNILDEQINKVIILNNDVRNAEKTRQANEAQRIADDNEREQGFNSLTLQVNSELSQYTNHVQGWVNAYEYGMSPDNEDNSAAFQQLVDAGSTIIIPKGTYKFKSSVTITSEIEIEGNNSTFIFEGTGVFIGINGGKKIFNRLNVQSSLGSNASTMQVGFDMGDRGSSNRQIRFNMVNVTGFSDAGFLVNNDWHITWKHCTIQNCGAYNVDNKTGGIVIRGENLLSAWQGSGNILEDCYLSGCNHGLYDSGGWNIALYNCIFEYNNYPIYKGGGSYISTNRCWFENNTNPCRGGGFESNGDRGFSITEANSIYKMYTRCYDWVIRDKDGNDLFAMTDGKMTKFTLSPSSGLKTSTDINGVNHFVLTNGTSLVGEGGGTTSAGKPGYENSVLRLMGYGGYWSNSVDIAPTPLSVLDLHYTSNGGGSGQGYGGFDFKAATINGGSIMRELTSVFGVDYNGNITPMQLNGTSNIGSPTAGYNNVYANAIILTSPNGTKYQLTVDDNGNLTTKSI